MSRNCCSTLRRTIKKYWIILTAVLTRLLFACHSFIAIWRLTDGREDPEYWNFAVLMAFLLLETIHVVASRQGIEWRW